MKSLLVTADEIAAWSDKIEARHQLAALLRILVHYKHNDLKKIDFPAFKNSQRSGWDGWVDSKSETPWIPLGKSGWEFGCSKNVKSKADSDYKSRTNKIAPVDRKTITYVFVTPRNWPGKEKWAKDKKGQCSWKDVRALDASDLEQWLVHSVPAQMHFREFTDTAIQDVDSLDRIWNKWAEVTEPALSRKLFAAAAQQHQGTLKTWLCVPPVRPLVVAATSHLEALAFLSCAIHLFDKSDPGTYARAIVIHSRQAFNHITISSSNFIAIVASSDAEQDLAEFHKKTHTIIVRGSNELIGVRADIMLDFLSRNEFQEALKEMRKEMKKEMRFDNQYIDRLARESAHSPTILRQRLTNIPAIKCPPWSKDNTILQALIPFTFAGAWDSNATGDREILCYLTGNKYDEIEKMIAHLQKENEPPVWSIGNCCGVISKINALYPICKLVTLNDLEHFLIAAEIVLSENDPSLELPADRRWAADFYKKSREHSSILRKSICDTLVLMAALGNVLFREHLKIDIEAMISHVVYRLLTPPSKLLWLSQQKDLPYYAEAAPLTFLRIVEEDLSSSKSIPASLLAPVKNNIFDDCPRMGLLWALELLAWDPQYLTRVALILAQLCKWEIDDNVTNTPIITLVSIFNFQRPQTAATLKERNRALATLAEKFSKTGWQIYVNQFYPELTPILENHHPRWRVDAHKSTQIVMTHGELRQAKYNAIMVALDWLSHDAQTLGDLVECLRTLNREHRHLVWERILDWNKSEPDDEQKAMLREQIRRYAPMRRSQHRNQDDELRDQARNVYDLLEPANLTFRHLWLFLQSWIDSSADEIENREFDHNKRIERIAQQRREALIEIWQHSEMRGILNLCRLGEASRDIGYHFAEIHTHSKSAVDFIEKLLLDKSVKPQDKINQCIVGFLLKLNSEQKCNTLSKLLDRLSEHDELRIRLLLSAPLDGDTWHHVDGLPDSLSQRYWKEIDPNWQGWVNSSNLVKFVDKLLEVDRPYEAFYAAHMNLKFLDSHRLVHLLTKVATYDAEPSDRFQFSSNYISEALDVLEERGNISCDQLARLEFMFITILRFTRHGIPNLDMQLSKTPLLFMQMLALAFPRDDGSEDSTNGHLSNSDNNSNTGAAADLLLRSAHRVPGTQADGSIDAEVLKKWLKQVRKLTHQHGRASIGDEKIGQLLSHCPVGEDGVWPCEPVRDAIANIASTDIGIGMCIGVYNSRGVTRRGKGGTQEYELADQYRRWSHQIKDDCPYTSDLLKQIAYNYDLDAESWDTRDDIDRRL